MLQDFLEIRVAMPTSFSPDGRHVLVLSNLTGTRQLYRVPVGGGELEQLTDHPHPVYGSYLPGGGRILLQTAVGGNERLQLSLLVPDTREPQELVHDPGFIHRYGDADDAAHRI